MDPDVLALSWKEYLQKCYKDDLRRVEELKISLPTSVLDLGCGGGGFIKTVKDLLPEILIQGVEPDFTFRSLLNNEGIKVYDSVNDVDSTYDLITAFHVFEHLKDPISTLESLKKALRPGGKVLIEVPNAYEEALSNVYNCSNYRDFTHWKCHLFYFSLTSLSKVVEEAGFQVCGTRYIQRYSLSNHLYWLSKGKPGGHKILTELNSQRLDLEYENKLSEAGIADTLSIMCEVSK